jgi:very-short-patch-repair endonuclease
MPAHAFFCSVTAAIVMGVPLPWWCESAPELHVAVPAPQRALRGVGIVGHKLNVQRARITEFEGVRLSNPEDTWCQLGSVLRVPDLVAAGDFLVHWKQPLTTIELLRQALYRHPGRRGKPALRVAVELLNPQAESPQESRLRVILIEGGLKDFVVNVPITTSGGYSYRPDIAFPAQKVILEYQGADHLLKERYRRDMTRISRLEADGWHVIQINADDLRDPGELLSRIRRVLFARSQPS